MVCNRWRARLNSENVKYKCIYDNLIHSSGEEIHTFILALIKNTLTWITRNVMKKACSVKSNFYALNKYTFYGCVGAWVSLFQLVKCNFSARCAPPLLISANGHKMKVCPNFEPIWKNFEHTMCRVHKLYGSNLSQC